MTENWRTGTNAEDYFSHQQKRLALEQRRPVIRKASDLVGPGIDASAVRITDFNDALATFNGFFSAEGSALNAPANEDMTGWTSVDSELGGVQYFTGLVSGNRYIRTFRRAPFDPETITWAAWSIDYRIPPTARAISSYNTTVPSGIATLLRAPSPLGGVGVTDTYSTTGPAGGGVINVLKPGVYTGSVSVESSANFTLSLTVSFPYLLTSDVEVLGSTSPANGIRIPITVIHTGSTPGAISIEANQTSGSNQVVRWTKMNLTRTGDAV